MLLLLPEARRTDLTAAFRRHDLRRESVGVCRLRLQGCQLPSRIFRASRYSINSKSAISKLTTWARAIFSGESSIQSGGG